MKKSKIRIFRKNLRKFDRLNELLNNTCCIGVTMAQCHALLEIEELGKTTTIQLAKNLILDKSTLSRTVDSLVKLGLVERTANIADRRFTTLILTSKGVKLCNEINQANDTNYGNMLSQLTQKEVENILTNFDLFVKIANNFMKGSSEKNGCCNS
jgi:DNA-binding MarR family transcriptional regulator